MRRKTAKILKMPPREPKPEDGLLIDVGGDTFRVRAYAEDVTPAPVKTIPRPRSQSDQDR